jgi:hypothetical protein
MLVTCAGYLRRGSQSDLEPGTRCCLGLGLHWPFDAATGSLGRCSHGYETERDLGQINDAFGALLSVQLILLLLSEARKNDSLESRLEAEN